MEKVVCEACLAIFPPPEAWMGKSFCPACGFPLERPKSRETQAIAEDSPPPPSGAAGGLSPEKSTGNGWTHPRHRFADLPSAEARDPQPGFEPLCTFSLQANGHSSHPVERFPAAEEPVEWAEEVAEETELAEEYVEPEEGWMSIDSHQLPGLTQLASGIVWEDETIELADEYSEMETAQDLSDFNEEGPPMRNHDSFRDDPETDELVTSHLDPPLPPGLARLALDGGGVEALPPRPIARPARPAPRWLPGAWRGVFYGATLGFFVLLVIFLACAVFFIASLAQEMIRWQRGGMSPEALDGFLEFGQAHYLAVLGPLFGMFFLSQLLGCTTPSLAARSNAVLYFVFLALFPLAAYGIHFLKQNEIIPDGWETALILNLGAYLWAFLLVVLWMNFHTGVGRACRFRELEEMAQSYIIWTAFFLVGRYVINILLLWRMYYPPTWLGLLDLCWNFSGGFLLGYQLLNIFWQTRTAAGDLP